MLQDNFLIQPQQLLIECVINAQSGNTTTLNPFQEQDFLINRPIIGLQCFCADDMANSPLATYLPVIPASLLPYAFLNISRSGTGPIKAGVWYKNIPLVSLRHSLNFTSTASSNLDMFRCDPMVMQWRDSNVAFPSPTAQALAQYSVPILVTYLLEQQDPVPYRQAFINPHHQR